MQTNRPLSLTLTFGTRQSPDTETSPGRVRPPPQKRKPGLAKRHDDTCTIPCRTYPYSMEQRGWLLMIENFMHWDANLLNGSLCARLKE